MENANKNNRESNLGALPRRFTMTAFFILCYLLIHVNFEYTYWMTVERDVFSKYENAVECSHELDIAKDVYFTKATWMFALIVMMALGISFRSAIAYSFMLYSVELMLLFPIRLYTVLNLLLAAGCVLEDLIDRVKACRNKVPV
jgi:hypothetical protein